MIILRKSNNTRQTNNPDEAQEWVSDGYKVIKGVKELSKAKKIKVKQKAKPKAKPKK